MGFFQNIFGKKEDKSEFNKASELKKQELDTIKLYLDNMRLYITNATEGFNDELNSLKEWISFLYNKKLEHKEELKTMKSELKSSVKHNHIDDLKQTLSVLSYKASKLEENQTKLMEKYELILAKLSALESSKSTPDYRTNLQNKVIKQVNKNSKAYIKSTVLNLIRKHGDIKTSQLRDIVVDELKICSQSTLYRILNEIRSKQEINTSKIDKEFVYSFN